MKEVKCYRRQIVMGARRGFRALISLIRSQLILSRKAKSRRLESPDKAEDNRIIMIQAITRGRLLHLFTIKINCKKSRRNRTASLQLLRVRAESRPKEIENMKQTQKRPQHKSLLRIMSLGRYLDMTRKENHKLKATQSVHQQFEVQMWEQARIQRSANRQKKF